MFYYEVRMRIPIFEASYYTMRKFIVFLILIVLGLSSCQKKEVSAEPSTVAIDTLKIRLRPFKDRPIALSKEAQGAVQFWEDYHPLRTAIDGLNNSEIGTLKQQLPEWVSTSRKLIDKIPDTVKTNSIRTRALFLNAKFNMLQIALNKQKLDTIQINQEATELYNAFQNLNGQLNVKFLKSIEDYIKEFEEENEKSSDKKAVGSKRLPLSVPNKKIIKKPIQIKKDSN